MPVSPRSEVRSRGATQSDDTGEKGTRTEVITGITDVAEVEPPDISALMLFRAVATGGLVWTVISGVMVFGPSTFADIDRPLVQALGPVLLLIASATAQLASDLLRAKFSWISGLMAAALGVAAVLLGGWLPHDPLALLGFVVVGAGCGLAYRASLLAVTRGQSPARQGGLASLYAAVTYGCSAISVLVIGWWGSAIGMVAATIGTGAGIVALMAASLLWAPRLRDTIDPPRRTIVIVRGHM